MARMITAPGIIRHIDKYTNTMRKLQFSIAVGDWTESSGVYTAEWLNDYITTSSFEIATYDHTLRDNGKGDIELEKKSGGGGLVFTTNALPTGTITGIVYVFDTQDGKLPVLLEDGTVEIEQGGTGATTASGALANFGLDNAEHAQEALGFGDAVQMDVANSLATSQEGYVLDARQGKALNDTLNSKFKTMSSGSLHDIKTTGMYYLTGGVADKPVNNGGYYSVTAYSADLVVGIYTSTDGYVFSVVYMNNTWTYKELAQNSNLTTITQLTASFSPSISVNSNSHIYAYKYLKTILITGFVFITGNNDLPNNTVIATISNANLLNQLFDSPNGDQGSTTRLTAKNNGSNINILNEKSFTHGEWFSFTMYGLMS